MSVFIPAFSCSRESLTPTSSLRERYSVPPYLHQGRKEISFPCCSINIRGNWKIPCVWGLCFFHDSLCLRRQRGEPFKEPTKTLLGFPCGSVVKKLPAWEILWTEDPGGLQSMGSHRVGHDLATKQQDPYTLGTFTNLPLQPLSAVKIHYFKH